MCQCACHCQTQWCHSLERHNQNQNHGFSAFAMQMMQCSCKLVEVPLHFSRDVMVILTHANCTASQSLRHFSTLSLQFPMSLRQLMLFMPITASMRSQRLASRAIAFSTSPSTKDPKIDEKLIEKRPRNRKAKLKKAKNDENKSLEAKPNTLEWPASLLQAKSHLYAVDLSLKVWILMCACVYMCMCVCLWLL